MNKPVNCRCGGKPQVISYLSQEYCKMLYYVRCVECGTETDDLFSEAEAITVWNKVMGERTAKVENQYRDYLPYTRFMTEELRGNCEKCGETVWKGEKYCHECGARLEWK